jgi:hypothetical protein
LTLLSQPGETGACVLVADGWSQLWLWVFPVEPATMAVELGLVTKVEVDVSGGG